MARSKRNCVTIGREIGISPSNTLKIARQLGAVHLHTVNDPVGGPLRAHILRIRSDPARTESWSRLVHLVTLPPSPQIAWDEANELFTLTRELRYVKPPKGTRSASDEGRRRQQIDAKAASAKRRADANAARERLRQAATKGRHCNACGSDFVSDSPLHGCKQSKRLAKRARALIDGPKSKRTQPTGQTSNIDLPVCEPSKPPEYRWREIPSGHPGSGRRRR